MIEIVKNLKSDDGYALARARAILTVYGEKWHAHWAAYDVLHVEHEFKFPLVNPETSGMSRSFEEAGKVDVLVRHRQSGSVHVVEHKTTVDSVAPDSDYWDRLRMDTQCSKYYLWAMQAGYDRIQSVIYDVMRKPSHRPSLVPDRDAEGFKIVRDRAGQRVYTSNGKKPRETADAEKGYELQGHIETPDEFQARLTTILRENIGDYFAQRETPRLSTDILEYMEDAWALSQQILYARKKNLWPRNPQACDQYGKCEMFDLCCGRASVDGIRYRKVEKIHAELNIQGSSELQLLTNSRGNTHRRCARLHKLRYEDGIEAVAQDKEALKLGTLVHLGLEQYFKSLMQSNINN